MGFGTGDTVNIASRMESNSEALKIHCSEAAAKLVKVQDPSLYLIPRGAIPIKGKSKMNTFWVHDSNSSKDAGMYIYKLIHMLHHDMMQDSRCGSSHLSPVRLSGRERMRVLALSSQLSALSSQLSHSSSSRYARVRWTQPLSLSQSLYFPST